MGGGAAKKHGRVSGNSAKLAGSMPFQSLNLGPNILKAVQEAGYTEPTPIQAAAIPLILAGQD